MAMFSVKISGVFVGGSYHIVVAASTATDAKVIIKNYITKTYLNNEFDEVDRKSLLNACMNTFEKVNNKNLMVVDVQHSLDVIFK